MQRTSFRKRFLIPTLLALTLMVFARLVYLGSARIDSPAVYQTVAAVSAAVEFASIVLAPLLLYPLCYFRGAGPWERVIAGSLNLAVWVSIDVTSVSGVFPLSVSLYYGLMVGSILLAWILALMGLLELACRSAVRRRGEPVRVWTPLPLVPVVIFALVVYLLSLEGGARFFNLFLDGYQALFRS